MAANVCFNEHLLIHSTDSFKRLIHSEMSQLAVIKNGPLNQLTHSIHSKTWIRSETKQHCVRAVRYDDIYRMDEIKSLSFHIMFYRLYRGVAKYIVSSNTFSSFE